MVSLYLALLWCVDHSKGENYHFMTNTPEKFDLYFIFCQLRTAVSIRRSYNIRCIKNSLEKKLSSPVPRGQSEQFSLKSIKEIYIPAKIINTCQFITDPLK